MNLLRVNNISKSFSGVKAVQSFSFKLDKGQIVGIIGPNGAGKSTAFNIISGIYPAEQGEILLEGEHLEKLEQHKITQQGLARTFQNIRLFTGMNVLENVMTASDQTLPYSFFDAVMGLPKKRRSERENIERSYELLRQLDIHQYALQKVDSLAYGTQRKVEIARSLATNPKILMLDEPAAGLNPNEVQEFNQIIRNIRDNMGISILLIEHHMDVIMELCDYIYVLNFGKLLAEGTAEEIKNNHEVTAAYIGEEDD